MTRILTGLFVLALLAAAAPAAAALCPACQEMGFTADVGQCVECGAHTGSGAFHLCPACSARMNQCEACRAPLDPAVTTRPAAAPAPEGFREIAEGLYARLVTDREEYEVGQAPEVSVEFLNRTGQAIRLYHGLDDDMTRPVHVTFSGGEMADTPLAMTRELRPVTEADYLDIPAGEEPVSLVVFRADGQLRDQMTIRRFAAAGEYAVAVEYRLPPLDDMPMYLRDCFGGTFRLQKPLTVREAAPLPPAAFTALGPQLAARLVLDREAYAVGQSPEVSVEFLNLAGRDARFLHGLNADEVRLFRVAIDGPDLEEQALPMTAEFRSVGPGDYLTLAGGEGDGGRTRLVVFRADGRLRDQGRIVRFAAPGEYTITVDYALDEDEPRQLELAADCLRPSIHLEVRVTVTE